MPKAVVVGGGVVGLLSAMLLAHDGHDVTVLERDPAPPPGDADEAWESWERRGVNQFRMIHLFLPRFRQILEAELPEVVPQLVAAGALEHNPIEAAPDFVTGGAQPGDERFTQVTGRRPVVESVIGRLAEATPGVTIRRGAVVNSLVAGDQQVPGVPHVVGVRLDDGEEVAADVVIDAAGRRSALPQWIEDLGARPPLEDKADCGFIYYGRHFRGRDGQMPVAFGPPLQAYGSFSVLTLMADNCTYGVGVVSSAKDVAARVLSRVEVWDRVVRACPLVAHWADGEPIDDGVAVMAKIEDRQRHFVIDGVPVVTGVLPVGDSWACTNPSVGRGASIGLMHAVQLRDLLRRVGVLDQGELATQWHEVSETAIGPYVHETLEFDRHRLAEIEANIDGRVYETDDVGWNFGKRLGAATMSNPDLLRASIDIATLNALGAEVAQRPGMVDLVFQYEATSEPPPGPDREQFVALLTA